MDEKAELAQARVQGAVGKAIPLLQDVLAACEASEDEYHLGLATEVYALLEEFKTIKIV